MFVTCLQKILAKKVLEAVTPEGTAVLREKKGKAVTEIEVSGLGGDLVVIRLDPKIGRLTGIKDGPWTKLCDYAIVSSGNGKVRVLFVELKETLNSEKGYEQLRRSLPVLKYLYSMCEIESGHASGQLEVGYALVAKKVCERFDKQSVKPKPLPIEMYKNISIGRHIGRRVSFNRLWSR